MSGNGKLARAALERGRYGSLAVIEPVGGRPYVSLVNYACDDKGLPIFLFSSMARHTQCLLKDQRASLLIAEIPTEGDALAGLRASFSGTMTPATKPEVKALYVSKHPYAAGYAEFGDFSFWKLTPELVHLVGGFGRIETLKAEAVF